VNNKLGLLEEYMVARSLRRKAPATGETSAIGLLKKTGKLFSLATVGVSGRR
jgi:hypothetical protein